MNWMWNEFRQTGRNYSDPEEVARYDKTHADFRDIEAEAQRTLDLLEIGNGQALLDIGCGTGSFAIAAARRCRSVIGIDESKSMLAEAAKKAAACGLQNVRFEQHGFLTYEHPSDPLDAVTTTFALHHLPDFWQAVALRRIYAMLAPGGRFHMCL